MTIITGKIGSGKTAELVRYAIKNNCTIICQFEGHIKCMQDLSQRLYGRDVKAISYSNFFYNGCFRGRKNNTKYVIDDIELFLMRLMTERGSASSIEGFTCDGEDIIFKERINGEYCDFWNLNQINFIVRSKFWQFPKLNVDFDGTLFSVSKNWPKVGKQKLIHKLVANYVRHKHRQGCIIILNTMREPGKGLEQAKEACEMYKIPIDLYNENYQPDIDRWSDSRKIGAQLSIDDAQVGLIGWLLRRFG